MPSKDREEAQSDIAEKPAEIAEKTAEEEPAAKEKPLALPPDIFADKPDIEEYRSIAKAISLSPKAKQILTLGYIPNHQFGAIYAWATLYVQPSFY